MRQVVTIANNPIISILSENVKNAWIIVVNVHLAIIVNRAAKSFTITLMKTNVPHAQIGVLNA